VDEACARVAFVSRRAVAVRDTGRGGEGATLPARIDALARALGRPIEPRVRDGLVRYAELVLEWNARLDLTAATALDALVDVLFADALVMGDRELVPEEATLLDVGSGAGAPALPFAILRPDSEVAMLEPTRKRVAFLRTAIGSLGLEKRVRVIEGRLDPRAPRVHADCDVASARATFPPERWVKVALAIAPACLVFTAGDPPGSPVHRVDYALPSSRAPRVLARYERAIGSVRSS
jgi:16S rRNA (guanine527-N7)-methyltransferase